MEKIKNKYFLVFRYIFVAVVIFLLGKSLYLNWGQIRAFPFDLNIFVFVISVGLMTLSVFISSLLWRMILKELSNKELSIHRASFVHFFSWLCRYIPGKVGLVLAKIIMCKKDGYKTKDLVLSSFYENVLMVMASFLIGAPVVFVYFSDFIRDKSLFYILYTILILLSIFIILNPVIFSKLLNSFSKVGKYSLTQKGDILPVRRVFYYLFLYLLPRLLSGIGFFLLILSIMPLEVSFMPYSIGVYSLAGVIGLLAIFAPSGIGVREAVMIFALKDSFPLGVVVLISVLARVWATLSDLLILIFVGLYKSLCKNTKQYQL